MKIRVKTVNVDCRGIFKKIFDVPRTKMGHYDKEQTKTLGS